MLRCFDQMDGPVDADGCSHIEHAVEPTTTPVLHSSSATCTLEGLVQFRNTLSNSFGLVVIAHGGHSIRNTSLNIYDVVFKAKDGWSKESIAEIVGIVA